MLLHKYLEHVKQSGSQNCSLLIANVVFVMYVLLITACMTMKGILM